jgi:hypothetical protein
LLSLIEAQAAQPAFVEAKEAARLLSVPESWLRDQARKKRVPVTYLGRYPRFNVAELLAWADARTEGPRVRTGANPVPRSTGGQ